jgi:hypothetical protein
LVNTKGQGNWKLRTAVPIERVVRIEQEENVAVLDQPVLEIGSGESYAVRFGIDHFEPEPDPTAPRTHVAGEAPA